MWVAADIPKLGAACSGDEPQIRAGRALLVRHRTRFEVTVGAPRGHHRDLDFVDQAVELFQFGFHRASSLIVVQPQ